MAEQFRDQQFIEFLVKSIVNHPDDVKTERTVDERGVLLTLYVNQEDMGYVIGRQGQTARALRILLKIVGAKEDARVNLKIYEPENMRREHQERRGKEAGAPGMGGGMNGGMGGGMGGGMAAAPAEARHGASGLVSDDDLADLGI